MRGDAYSRSSKLTRSRTLPRVVTCASCGAENPDGFRFCGACGADLSTPAGREVRKTVTVVFADVTGSTALGERLDPESLRRVMSRYFDEAQTVLEHHGGTVEKFIGDAVMAVFGVPTLHEDDALRALRAAAEMRERLEAVSDELERDLGVRLQVRTGVNTGEVVTDDAAAGQRLATGDAVNVAARLEQAAAPGEILIGAETRELAHSAIETEPAGERELKGKAEPLPAYRLLRVVEGAAPFARRLDAPIVGRDDELARARAAFDAAVAERRCRLLTVLGPPGIGKSRLARELSASVNGAATVLMGQCRSYGEGITYWPVREIFEAAGAVPELEEALASGSSEDAFWAIRKALEQRAREHPLLLVVEDIHWAEATLLDLLEHLVDWTRDAPVLLVCLARPDLLDARPTWVSGRPNAETLMLEPLAAEETDALIASLLGDGAMDAETRERIQEVAEGNPLFVEQLLANASDGDEPARVPGTIQALLAARLDGLPDGERNVLERAAVLGVDFEWEALGELLDGGRPPGATLVALVRKEFIRPHETEADAFRFRHVLIRDAAYARVPKELRADLHERVARRLEGEGLEAIVGYHLEQAVQLRRELGERGAAVDTLAEEAGTNLAVAGTRAHRRFDLAAAANLLERARGLLPPGPKRVDVLLRLADTLGIRGQVAESKRVSDEVLVAARECGDPHLQLRARLEHTFANEFGAAGGLELATEAVSVFEAAGDEENLLFAVMYLAGVGTSSGRLAAATDATQRALGLARRLGEYRHETDMIAAFSATLVWGPAAVRDGIRRLEQELGDLRKPGLQAPGHVFLGLLYALDGRFDEARRLFDHGQEIAGGLGGLDWPIAWSRGGLGARIELLAGEPEAAEREARAALEAHTAMGERRTLPDFNLRIAEALWAQGRDEEGAAIALAVEEQSPDPQLQARWRFVRAQAHARRGALETSERLAREALDVLAPTDLLWDQGDAQMALADVLRRGGRDAEAQEATRAALALYGQKGHLVGAERARAALAA
jgi:class 3 adenylate cyclase/tetratricopeptide (TPR) repeat protein